MNAEPGGGRILIASNRGPVSFTRGEDGNLTRHRGAGGLVSGLSTVAGRAHVLWVCAALSDADRAAARAAPDGRIDAGADDGDGLAGASGADASTGVRMLDIPATTFHRAYNSVANSTLWFVHHMLYDTPNRPNFGLAFRREWESFRGYNATFAAALAEGAGDPGGGVRAMVQDYHLTLVPRMLADLRSDIRIAHFSHTPWAPPDYFKLLPESVGREVLEGILGADHAGFLAQRWADAFVDCCREFLGADIDPVARTVTHRGHVTSVGVHALGVDADDLRQRAAAADVQAQVAALTAVCGDRKLIVRVDRTELSKNIVRGLLAAAGQRDRERVRSRRLGSPPAGGERRLPALARRVPAGRCAAGQSDPGRHEPRREGRPHPVRTRLCAGPVHGGRRRGGTRRSRAAGQPVRRDGHRARPARSANHARYRTKSPQRGPRQGRVRAAAHRLVPGPARRPRPGADVARRGTCPAWGPRRAGARPEASWPGGRWLAGHPRAGRPLAAQPVIAAQWSPYGPLPVIASASPSSRAMTPSGPSTTRSAAAVSS